MLGYLGARSRSRGGDSQGSLSRDAFVAATGELSSTLNTGIAGVVAAASPAGTPAAAAAPADAPLGKSTSPSRKRSRKQQAPKQCLHPTLEDTTAAATAAATTPTPQDPVAVVLSTGTPNVAEPTPSTATTPLATATSPATPLASVADGGTEVRSLHGPAKRARTGSPALGSAAASAALPAVPSPSARLSNHQALSPPRLPSSSETSMVPASSPAEIAPLFATHHGANKASPGVGSPTPHARANAAGGGALAAGGSATRGLGPGVGASAASAAAPGTSTSKGAGSGAGAGAGTATGTAVGGARMAASAADSAATATIKSLTNELAAVRASAAASEERLRRALLDAETKAKEDRDKRARSLEAFVREVLQRELVESRRKLSESLFRVGRIATHRAASYGGSIEVWEDGIELRKLASKTAELKVRREALEKAKKEVAKKRREENAIARARAAALPASVLADGASYDTSALQTVLEEERVKVHLSEVIKQQARLDREKQALEGEKSLLIMEIRRTQDEEQSRFNHRPVLNSGRYLLLNLLGKGGFSEVWRAMDLWEGEERAVKIHQLRPEWSDERKAQYVKHAAREFGLQQRLRHDNVVRVEDVFEIDDNAFGTALEYCRGPDLDKRLKEEGQLSEREARVIVLQVVSALCHLDQDTDHNGDKRPRIIHYDLKPANILFDESMNAKITDFGLSKAIEGGSAVGEATGLELTSQGAGTYWYLPPECFQVGPTPPRISNKVDVWSLGVVFFQMLYGKRPFGDGLSQEKLLQDQVILRAAAVEFPSKPSVSPEAKKFIQDCLTPSQHLRPDVRALHSHEYLRRKP